METQIITNGVNEFTPLIERLGDIATEFIPYLIFIGICCLTYKLAYVATGYVLAYLKNKSYGVFGPKGTKGNERVYYNRKQHNRDEKHGKLKNEREYYK